MTKVAAEVGLTVNNYEILGKLAAGGMAEIFLARSGSEAGVERYVVLKRILRHRADDAVLVRMFLDEARLAAQLQHANIAQVYDIGKLGDSYFFTMEYVHGETVRSVLHRANGVRYPIPIGCVLTVAAGAAAGLHYAHERKGMDGRPLGIVHRDVSPSNLMVSYDGTIKIVDFGIAKATDQLNETAAGTVKGKISYLSPEQCKTELVDRRSDLFSLGIVFWEMLTTRRLYRRPSDFENMTAIVNEPAPPPSTFRPEIPPELDALSLRLLAKSPDQRFQSAADLLEGLEQIAIRSGTVLSIPAVARFLRDLFGLRPEPWINTQMSEAAEGVTVTTGPVAVDHGPPKVDALDLQLEAVPDWTHKPSTEGPGLDSWSSPMSVGPFHPPPIVANEIDEGTVKSPPPSAPQEVTGVERSGPVTLPRESEDEVPVDITKVVPLLTRRPTPLPLQEVVPAPIASVSARGVNQISPPPPAQRPAIPAAPVDKPAVVPIVAPLAVSPPSVALPLQAAVPPEASSRLPAAVPLDRPATAAPSLFDEPTRIEVGTRRKRAVIVGLVGVVAVIAIVIWFATRSTAPDVVVATHQAPHDADSLAPAEAGESDVVKSAIEIDVPAHDAGLARPAARDAGIVRPPARPDPAIELARAFRAGRFGEAVSTCSSVGRLSGPQATMCAVSACNTRDVAKVKRWLAGSRRGEVVAACRTMGIDLDPAPAKPPPRRDAGVDCGKDLMGCQH